MPDWYEMRTSLDLPTRVRLHRLAYRIAYRMLQVWWFVRRPHTSGVKLLIADDAHVLFVRHAYGNRRHWELPGGGLRRGENPLDAARREAHEELGVDLVSWRTIGSFEARDHATAHLTCLTSVCDREAVRLDPIELEEARWAPPTTPPRPLGPHAAVCLAITDDAPRGEPKP